MQSVPGQIDPKLQIQFLSKLQAMTDDELKSINQQIHKEIQEFEQRGNVQDRLYHQHLMALPHIQNEMKKRKIVVFSHDPFQRNLELPSAQKGSAVSRIPRHTHRRLNSQLKMLIGIGLTIIYLLIRKK